MPSKWDCLEPIEPEELIKLESKAKLNSLQLQIVVLLESLKLDANSVLLDFHQLLNQMQPISLPQVSHSSASEAIKTQPIFLLCTMLMVIQKVTGISSVKISQTIPVWEKQQRLKFSLPNLRLLLITNSKQVFLTGP